MQCFNEISCSNLFAGQNKALSEAIGSLTADQMDRTDRDAWIDHFCSRFELDPIVLYQDYKSIDVKEQPVRVRSQWRLARYEPEYLELPGIRAVCRLPFSGDRDLLRVQPSVFSLSGYYEVDRVESPSGDKPGYIVFSYEGTLDDASNGQLASYFAGRIEEFSIEVGRVNDDVEKFNAPLRESVEKLIDRRVAQLDKYASIRRDLGLPLERVKDAPLSMPLPLKKKVVLGAPKPSGDGENSYSINDCDYAHINDVIERCGCDMEAAPGSFAYMEEEQIRDHIRTVLSTHYDNVTGETFRNKGKTDIHIPFEGHAAYIAEFKLWHGPKGFLKAIDQLFSYTTWRDTKVTLAVFNKRVKDFDSVIGKVDETLREASTECRQEDAHRWACKIMNPEADKVMHVSVLIFDLHDRPVVA